MLSDRLNTLCDLAKDCLRLSLHFFHPIQQCAQQIYHTALPLSPTSSHLRNSWLQRVTDDQLSHVTAFSGVPCTWGLLQRTIDVRPRELTCIATSGQSIIAGCGEIVEIYDAITGVFKQSLSASETVKKIQASSDGSTLFFAHPLSVTMWDVQTGGLIHTFTTESQINDIAVSMVGDYVACGSLDGSVKFWNIRTKEEGKYCGNGQPVVAICWSSPQRLAFTTEKTLHICDVSTEKPLDYLIMSDVQVWGMLYLRDKDKFLVGTSGYTQSKKWTSLEPISLWCPKPFGGGQATVRLQRENQGKQSSVYSEGLTSPTLVDKEVACIISPSGVQLFNIESHKWTSKPLLLNMATSVAVSLNRNLVAQTNDSIQVFSLDILTSGETGNDTHPPCIYPLGDDHICVLQPMTRHLTLLELQTMRELHPDDDASSLGSLLTNQSLSVHLPSICGVAIESRISAVMDAWQSRTPLPGWTPEGTEEEVLLSGSSPYLTQIITIYGRPRREICVIEFRRGHDEGRLPLGDELEKGEVYDLTFDSETRFHLKFKGPGWHVQIPYEITPRSEYLPVVLTKGEPVPLPEEPQAALPYTLDANLEWVLDTESRKICWIPPGNIRKGNDGHFWTGLSLVMAGDDGVVRKLTFKEPDC